MRHLKKLVLALVCTLAVGTLSATAIDLGTPNVIMKATSSPLDGCSLSFSLNQNTGYASYDATTTGDNTVTKAKVTLVLQKLVKGTWTNVSGTYLEDEQSRRLASVSGHRYVESGYNYRVEAVYTVWVGSKTYTETHHSQLEYYA